MLISQPVCRNKGKVFMIRCLWFVFVIIPVRRKTGKSVVTVIDVECLLYMPTKSYPDNHLISEIKKISSLKQFNLTILFKVSYSKASVHMKCYEKAAKC